MLHYILSADLSKSFCHLYLSFFNIFFSIDFARWESVGLPPHCFYRDSVNFNAWFGSHL